MNGKVWFVGAGPGAADLLTLRAAKVIGAADVVVWAASLVSRGGPRTRPADAEIVDSARLPLEDVRPLYERAAREGLCVARIHSGDPSLWGAVQEQRELCDEIGLPHETVPGVSAFSAVAALVGRELTIPEVAQSVILTRLGGRQDPMPAGEEVVELRAARDDDGAVPVGRPLRAAAGRAARRRLSPRHPCCHGLPGDLAGRAASPTAPSAPSPRPSSRTGSGSTRCSLSGPRWRPAAPARTCTTRGISTVSAARSRTHAAPCAKGSRDGPSREPELREPDLPRTAKVRPTARCAPGGRPVPARRRGEGRDDGPARPRPPDVVDVALPSGRRVGFAVESCDGGRPGLDGGRGEGCRRRSRRHPRRAPDRAVSWRNEAGIGLEGGEGVGVVTKPGLGIEVGEPAITSVPRAMITQAVAEVVDPSRRGVTVVISVPDGERMARKTTNARLGILGRHLDPRDDRDRPSRSRRRRGGPAWCRRWR